MTAPGDEGHGAGEKGLADPREHPEQHAARHTGEQAKGEPQEGTENELLDSEDHSEAGGSFGTADEDDAGG